MTETLTKPAVMKWCDWCGWSIKPTIEEGCTTDSCSMRPMPRLEGTDLFEVKRYARRLETDRVDLIDAMRALIDACRRVPMPVDSFDQLPISEAQEAIRNCKEPS
jgi:hypothetical protein